MSDALLPYPHDWKQLLNSFIPCFSKPQFGNFCQTATALAVSQYSTINRWSQLFTPKHQSSLNDFLIQSPWDDSEVHTRMSRMVCRRVKDAYIGVIDDTLSHKPYAEKMEHVGYYHDGLTKKEQKGHSVVTHGVISHELGFVPFDIQLYKKDGTTKNDIACAMIKRTQNFYHLPLYTVDSWYSCNRVLNEIKHQKSHFITEIKSNRNVTIGKRKAFVREHEKKKHPWVSISIKEYKYRYFQTSAFIAGLGDINLVFSQRYETEHKTWGETYYLITDILTLQGNAIIEYFLLRGGIEGFHREAKQQLGLEAYQLRKSRGIERYLFLVMLIYALLLLLNQQQMRSTLQSMTIGQLRGKVKAEYYTTLLQEAKHGKNEYIEKTARMLAFAL